MPTGDDNPSADDPAGGGGSDDQAVASVVEGTVAAADTAAGTVTIRRADGPTGVVKTGVGTRVERKDAHATLAAFRVGGAAQAELGSDGIALSAEATGP